MQASDQAIAIYPLRSDPGTSDASRSFVSTTILVVEDDAFSSDVLVRRLEKSGFSVSHASNLAQARSYMPQMPDMVLLDMMLPDGYGWSLAEELKASESYREIPIIGVSALAFTSDIEEAKCKGCDGYVIKPVDFSALLEEINRLLGPRPSAVN